MNYLDKLNAIDKIDNDNKYYRFVNLNHKICDYFDKKYPIYRLPGSPYVYDCILNHYNNINLEKNERALIIKCIENNHQVRKYESDNFETLH